VTVCLSLIIPINYPINRLTILSAAAIAGGLYFFCLGFSLLVRKRLLLTTPTSRIRSAAVGLVEVNGTATGPNTVHAPITGEPCFLYHTIAWRQSDSKKDDWDMVADETLHLPFFIDDSTGQLLIEPLGADLDLHTNFREEYDASSFSSNLANLPSRPVRIEERVIKPEDALFITGTIMENPGVQVRPLSSRSDSSRNDSSCNDSLRQIPAPEIIRLQSDAAPSSTHEMSQQAKIAAALNRAGITKPAAWSAAGIPYQSVAVEENATPPSTTALDEERLNEAQRESSDVNLAPSIILMKGADDSAFVISYRSQKGLVSTLAWKSAAMICAGTAAILLGLYMLLVQTGRL
jgi:hypothetical protein